MMTSLSNTEAISVNTLNKWKKEGKNERSNIYGTDIPCTTWLK